ncbi:MAG: thymidylate synthase [Chloroflexota bacterium]|nr:thymidylate synthase [Chloroflexota bacterium]
MICFEGTNADTVWRQALRKLSAAGEVQESRDQTTRELLHCAFVISDPRQRLVYARPINPAFALAEAIWIISGANDADFLSFWNPRMKRFTDVDTRVLFGAYGYRLGCQPLLSEYAVPRLRHEVQLAEKRLDQVKAGYEALRHIPHSRQVVLQLWNSTSDLPDPEPRSKDVPCNLLSHLMIRDGKLEWLQLMRSNDLIWGTPYNFIQFTTLQEIIAGWLGVEVGTYTHISDSLHVYQRHWQEVEHIEMDNAGSQPVKSSADLRIYPYEEWEKIWQRLVDNVLRLTLCMTAPELMAIAEDVLTLPPAYAEWGAVLAAEALRRRGFIEQAKTIIAHAGVFWATSWLQWAKTTSPMV